ncbi:hypothetical protein ACFLZG_05400 [Thermodesulfobacteriota bacterium]
MDKNRFKEAAKGKEFISGIYNYCDRWCERCPQTSHCLNYSMGEEYFSDPESRDIQNRVFWEKLTEVFRDTIALLEEKAASEGIDLDTIDTAEFEREDLSVRNSAENHEITKAAKVYIDMVESWFDSTNIIRKEHFEAGTGLLLNHTDGKGPEMSDSDDAIEVIRWYQHQIYIKLKRAISGLMEEEKETTGELIQNAKDSDGSAKIALMGIDRSIAAWSIMGRLFPSFDSNDVQTILTHLETLRRRVEQYFPDARAFIRPGFDIIDHNA